ncbi:MAG TPA: hypothetical protein VHF06_31835, partial [Pseudonocardiaceae bacterium]|nr:hypothetical protein [Pseudonocardiaceae bacterium]
IADGDRRPRLWYAALVRRAMLALLAGRLTDAERLVDRAAVLGAELGEPGAADVHFDQRWALADALGRLGELVDAAGDAFPDPDSPRARGFRALAMLAAGDKAGAAAVVAPLLADGIGNDEPPAGDPRPGGHGELLDAVHRAELAVGLDNRSLAEHAYATLLPYAELTAVSGAAVSFRGAVAHHLGVLARMLGRSSAAAAHLTCAVAVHERLGATTWTLRSRFELARTTSPSVCAEIADHARRLGMAGLVRDATPAFHRSGARWTLSYGGVTAHLRDSKGLADLAVLLSRPGRTVSAIDLAAGGDRHAHAGLSLGAGDVLDRAARERLRARLRDLDEEITDARDWSDQERVTRAAAERDDLLAALASAAGQAHRPRGPGDQDERARKAVTARIRDALGRIERVHPALGAHLSQSVSTGRLCCYAPKTPVTWRT